MAKKIFHGPFHFHNADSRNSVRRREVTPNLMVISNIRSSQRVVYISSALCSICNVLLRPCSWNRFYPWRRGRRPSRWPGCACSCRRPGAPRGCWTASASTFTVCNCALESTQRRQFASNLCVISNVRLSLQVL